MRQRGSQLHRSSRAHTSSRPTISSLSILYTLPCTLGRSDVTLPSRYSFLLANSTPSLRFSAITHEDATPEIEACIRYLLDLETIWVGARRSRLIIEELLKRSRLSATVWPMDGIGDDMGDFMLGQEGLDLRSFTFGISSDT